MAKKDPCEELKTELKYLRGRMNLIIRLLFRVIKEDDKALSERKKIELLSLLGLRPKEIAEVLGKKQSYVTKELTELRKDRERKHKIER